MSQGERWKKVETIFNGAVLLSPDERDFFIKENCGDDAELYDEVVSLISSDGEPDNQGLEQTVFPLIAELLEDEYSRLLNNPVFASYELEWLIGRGGMGAVFLAVDKKLERSVAIKVLPSSITENSRTALRFRQEAKAASAISHQNIAHIYEYGNYEGMYFLAMEYVAGKTLRELLKERQVDLPLAINVAIQTCQALKAAHKKRIVHRDIKPENIMLTEENLVKVVDFGIAKVGEKESGNKALESTPGLLIGTVNYMSPEQLRREGAVDERTDLWSLGVCLYEMLSGARPFDGETPSDTQAEILLKEPPPLEIAKQIPRLGKVIAKSLTKNVSARYQTADELLRELQLAQRDVYDYVKQSDKKTTEIPSIKKCPQCHKTTEASASSCDRCGFQFIARVKSRRPVAKHKNFFLNTARSATYFALGCAFVALLGGFVYVNQSSESQQIAAPPSAANNSRNDFALDELTINSQIENERKIAGNTGGNKSAALKPDNKTNSKTDLPPVKLDVSQKAVEIENGEAQQLEVSDDSETKPAVESTPTPAIEAKPTPEIETKSTPDEKRESTPTAKPSIATGRCGDGTLSYSKNKLGACSGHGGIAEWFGDSKSQTPKTETNARKYIRGSRGGCYYVNAKGTRTYVDASFCN